MTPLAIVLVIGILSAIAYTIQQPSATDEAYLSPRSTAGIGASRLADRLSARGVQVQRETHSSDALVSAHRGNATLLLPAPQLMHRHYLRMLKLLPASTQVVIVAPNRRTIANGLIPTGITQERLAARAVPPRCAFPPATAAGPAGVGRLRFGPVDDTAEGTAATGLYTCYGGSLIGYRRGAAENTLVGADDIFRNDRIDEHGNSELALGLLSRAPRVVWLDLHRPERAPGVVDDPALAGAPPAPASLRPNPSAGGVPEHDFPMPSGSEEALGPFPPDGKEEDRAAGGNPLWQAFPPSIFAAAALIGLAALLFALARGRRLAVPVLEPLPVAVRSTETVEGRGRLYQRAKARGATLTTLQTATRARLTRLLDLPSDAPADSLVSAVAAASGWSPDQVTTTLYPAPTDPAATTEAATTEAPTAEPAPATPAKPGKPSKRSRRDKLAEPGPADDRALVQAAVDLDTLLHAVTRQAPSNAVPEGDSR
ncbi:MAG TPA: DUF4350 domain-containing protein [Micromonosporaceae bacterium]|nr:DUF4350 domain-containing protein [Micromonosporaceae bacterium]